MSLYSESKVFHYRFDFADCRIDHFLQNKYPYLKKVEDFDLFLDQRVTVDNKPVDRSYVLKKGEIIDFTHLRSDEEPTDSEMDVLYEDEFLIAISKPDNVPVIPSGQYYYNSMAIRVKEQFNDEKISPLHRLDLETSGVLVFGKTDKAKSKIQKLFERKKIGKIYQAINFRRINNRKIEGDLVPEENSYIYTKQKLVESIEPKSKTLVLNQIKWGRFNRIWLKPITGKTNQLRVHLAALGAPIVGDKKYYPDEKVYLDWFENRQIEPLLGKLHLERQALHCEQLDFFNPLTEEKLVIKDTNTNWEKKILKLQVNYK